MKTFLALLALVVGLSVVVCGGAEKAEGRRLIWGRTRAFMAGGYLRLTIRGTGTFRGRRSIQIRMR